MIFYLKSKIDLFLALPRTVANILVKSKKAFTLAETLMCLWIIGVIAAMTIPTLMSNVEEKINVVKVKKVYATLSQSFQIAQLEYGTPDNWDLLKSKFENDADGKLIKTEYPGVKDWLGKLLSGTNAEDVEAVSPDYKNFALHGTGFDGSIDTHPLYRLPDGVTFSNKSNVFDPTCNYDVAEDSTEHSALKEVCAEIKLDINGPKKPNVWGKDTFMFYLTKNGIVPAGQRDETKKSLKETCNPLSFNRYNGFGCSAWVIEKENMNYIRKKISWDD